LTDEAGSITDAWSYSAFGELYGRTGTDPIPYAFAGEPLDPNSGFQYHRARWMDPRTGRFAGMDAFEGLDHEPMTLHRYRYAGADPVNRIDPTGRFETLAALSVGLSMLNTINAISVVNPRAILGAAVQQRFSLHLRSFAPWKTFGLGFGGDNRSFTTSLGVTSRIRTLATFRRPGIQDLDVKSTSDLSTWGPWEDRGTPFHWYRADDRELHLDVAGANPLVPSATIDLHLDLSIDDVGGETCFAGTLDGDAFPNAEIFVQNGFGRSTMLHTFATAGSRNLGPYVYLPGDNYRPMGSFRRCVQ
jgi:RHS repeat-associated protein